MNAEQIRRELARYSFLPGWRFELLEPDPLPGAMGHLDAVGYGGAVRIHSRVPNSYPPHDMIGVVATHPLPPWRMLEDPEAFAKWLRIVVHDRMTHEADEWLRRAGELLFDPHRGEKRRP